MGDDLTQEVVSRKIRFPGQSMQIRDQGEDFVSEQGVEKHIGPVLHFVHDYEIGIVFREKTNGVRLDPGNQVHLNIRPIPLEGSHAWQEPVKGRVTFYGDTHFEFEVYDRLNAEGYRVLPQVGAGWRFWRCWGSSWTRDPDGCFRNLIEALEEQGVDPIGGMDSDLSDDVEYREVYAYPQEELPEAGIMHEEEIPEEEDAPDEREFPVEHAQDSERYTATNKRFRLLAPELF